MVAKIDKKNCFYLPSTQCTSVLKVFFLDNKQQRHKPGTDHE